MHTDNDKSSGTEIDKDAKAGVEIEYEDNSHAKFLLRLLPEIRPNELSKLMIAHPEYFKHKFQFSEPNRMCITKVYELLPNEELLEVCTAYLNNDTYSKPLRGISNEDGSPPVARLTCMSIDANVLGKYLATKITGAALATLIVRYPFLINENVKLNTLSKHSITHIILPKHPAMIQSFNYMEFTSTQWMYICMNTTDIHTVANFVLWQNLSSDQIVTLVKKYRFLVAYIDLDSISDRTYCRIIKTLVQTETSGLLLGRKIEINWKRFNKRVITFNPAIIFAYRPDFYYHHKEIAETMADSECTKLDNIKFSIYI